MVTLNDYIEDRRFVKWALEPDAEIEAYFSAYLREHPEERAGLLKARETLRLLAVKQKDIPHQRKSEIYDQIVQKASNQMLHGKVSLVWRMIPYAAVALVFFALGILTVNVLESDQPYVVPESLLVKSAALNTMVYFADGTKKEISDSNMLIDFSNAGQLVLGSDTIKLQKTGAANASNMVVVPYGKHAQIQLSDRSMVELKAGSRILVPEQFNNDFRSAYLSGEGFFDIVKDPAHPFLVNTESTEIKVVGTSFRVEAYADMQMQTTFLKEGKVLLRNSNHSVLSGWTELKPNEQAVTGVSVREVFIKNGDAEAYSLWKKGIVKINNEPVQVVVRRIERYFNISIHLPNEQIRTRLLNGKMNLDTDLEEVFVYLERITDGKIEKVNAGEYVLQ